MLDLLETLASRVRDVPLLLLTQARPELLSERPAWGGGLPTYTTLQLEPLSRDDSAELARRLFDAAGAEGEAAPTLADTAEGNPLFLEELVASVAEGRGDARDLPTSIRGIVAGRIDALPARECEALLDAAVVGKVFWPGALGDTSSEILDALEGRDMIRRDPMSRLGAAHPQFAFKHQLIREVAYGTLPRARRHCTASSTSARSGATRNHSPRSGAQISTLATASRAN
jgi:predicted ATPase